MQDEDSFDLPTQDQPPPRSPVDEPGFALEWGKVDPLADGILMPHQKAWVEDQSDLKLAVKGRRTGFTYSEAHDSVFCAMEKSGDRTWYIGDTRDKAREFIKTCAEIAKTVAKEMLAVDEYVFDDVKEDEHGNVTTAAITAWRITFSSGWTIAGLSSRPSNIRGLQGRVVIDEAAFHRDVAEVIDACNALLIWGGKIRIISTHNGATNPFNELIKQTQAGRYDYVIHRATFDDAVAGGLYERLCLIKGEVPTPKGKAVWYRRIRRSYGPRLDAMREELDAIPREGDGVMLSLAWIEACSTPDHVVERWSPPAEDFVDWQADQRQAVMQQWLDGVWAKVAADVERSSRFPWAIGEDFAMRMDRTCIVIGYVDQVLTRQARLIIELRACPYEQQKQALFWLADRLPNFRAGILDANGNGMVLAQEARQRFGTGRITELMPNDAWQRDWSTKFQTAFQDRTIRIPADLDVRDDLQQFRIVGGVGKIPKAVRTKGTDGGRRHADAAIALLNFFAACEVEAAEYDYTPATPDLRRSAERPDHRGDDHRGGGDLDMIAGGGFGAGAW